ncbi:hypothetical protein I4I21_01540 [Lactiplantibacillus plantarum]|uniref:hypothetical protein n=1 Tax=Lactiplantibacillus plantarum TaxID=1590 RepID=UPI0007B560E6|nr:hypothetical protein [Lactiplantibacillus plantarum]AOB18160.1 hypothetical protein AVR82_00410 [Lactiplantibacillus plantarum]AOB21818.1 hypothetical protein AVR83_02225 [Lactiplantibacillus plantarum]KZU99870.1 hypothetical protein NAB1_2490 [Lactiplantibacillus plantarum]MBF9191455.1 hypothetical protein [Lactiplantibacillus plantarum]MDO8173970.1 hypothetical protein [Lactiplantibacillus plantarum]
MATKSFETEFSFNQKNAGALANALNSSKKVDIRMSKPVINYDSSNNDSLKKKFDKIFSNEKID